MTTLNLPGSTKDRVLFCPTCGGADVQTSQLAGGTAKCNVCNWSGQMEDLAVFPIQHNMGDPESIFRAFFVDLRKTLTGALATGIGQVLLKWGFIDPPDGKNSAQMTKTLVRYMNAVAVGVMKAIVEERQRIEKEGRTLVPDTKEPANDS